MIWRVPLVVLLSVVLAACASTAAHMAPGPGGASHSPIRGYLTDYQQTVAEGALGGAIVGGIIGAIASGGDSRRLLHNVAAGAVAGGVVGGGVGFMVAGRKQEFARREEALDSVIADGQARNARLAKLVSMTQALLAQRRREIEKVRLMRAGSAERAAERRKLVTDLEADRAALADAITQVEKSEQELAANITELRKRYPEGIPPTVVDLLDKHKQLLKGLSPDQLNDVIKNSMNLPA